MHHNRIRYIPLWHGTPQGTNLSTFAHSYMFVFEIKATLYEAEKETRIKGEKM